MSTERIISKLGPIREGGAGGDYPEDNVDTDSLVTDTLEFVVDDFSDRVVTPPTKISGSAVSFTSGFIVGNDAPHTAPVDVGDYVTDPSTDQTVRAYIGAWYFPHTHLPAASCCSGITNAFAGWHYREVWQKITVPAHPASMAGMMIALKGTITSALGNGYAESAEALCDVVVSSTIPTGAGQGTSVGSIPINGTDYDVFIPGASIPAEGATLYVGTRPSWSFNQGAYSCGWTWPFASLSGQVDCDGIDYQGLSGKFGVVFTSLEWQTWTVTPGSMGSTNSDPDADYEPRSWVDAGEEGSPTSYGIDSGLYVESTTAAGKGWYLPGPDEDDSVGDAPWSDGDGTRIEIDFLVDVIGDVAEPGIREIEMIVVGDGWRQSVKAHLGDAGHATGVSADGGLTTRQFVAKTITAVSTYTLAMDTRATELRAKLWAKTGLIVEPALWDVETSIGETTDDGDRFELWIRAGNESASQRVTVKELRMYPTAGDGDILVAELVGVADGVSSTFPTAHQYQRGSLKLIANGGVSAAVTEDAEAAEFSTDGDPTVGSILRVRYAKGESILDDEDEDDTSEVID